MRAKPEKFLWEFARLLRNDPLDAAKELTGAHVKSDDDWRALTPLAGRHRLLGYLVYLAKDIPSLPPLARDQAPRIYDGIRVRYSIQCAQVAEIVSSLADIPFRILKGLVIAHGAHRLAHLRPCGDIDLLVPSRFLIQTLQRLMTARFSFVLPHAFPWPPPQWLLHAPFPIEIDELALFRGAAVVELHTHIVSYKLPHKISEEELYASGDFVRLEEPKLDMPALLPDFVWLHLAMNYHMHRFSGGLGILLDLAKWEDLHPLNIDQIRRNIDRWSVRYLLDPVLRHLKAIFTDLPSVRLLGETLTPATEIFALSEKAWDSRVTPMYWIRQSPSPLRTLWRNIFLSRHAAAIRYGRSPDDPSLWFRRALRPFRLMAAHGQTVSRELRVS